MLDDEMSGWRFWGVADENTPLGAIICCITTLSIQRTLQNACLLFFTLKPVSTNPSCACFHLAQNITPICVHHPDHKLDKDVGTPTTGTTTTPAHKSLRKTESARTTYYIREISTLSNNQITNPHTLASKIIPSPNTNTRNFLFFLLTLSLCFHRFLRLFLSTSFLSL